MSVRPTVYRPSDWTDICVRDLQEICRTNPDLVQMGQKYHGTLPEDVSTVC
jgi:hypothetical protein